VGFVEKAVTATFPALNDSSFLAFPLPAAEDGRRGRYLDPRKAGRKKPRARSDRRLELIHSVELHRLSPPLYIMHPRTDPAIASLGAAASVN
jgi:hypothetical protein